MNIILQNHLLTTIQNKIKVQKKRINIKQQYQ